MLYKKYHRNFVSQFKKGSKFVWWMSDLQVNSDPFIENEIGWSRIKISARISRSRIYSETLEIVLVDIYGKITSEYNALEKIS